MISINNTLPVTSLKKQSGAAILITLFSLLVILTLLCFTTVNSVKDYARLVRNQTNHQKVFAAAESGINFGLAYLRKHHSTIVVDNNNSGKIANVSNKDITDVDNGNHSYFTISYTNPEANNFDLIKIQSSAMDSYSDSTVTISILAARQSGFITIPQATFTAKGSVSLSGNATITNISTGQTIRSGSNTSLNGSASTVSKEGVSSNKKSLAEDINQNDASLSSIANDDFFKMTFGQDKEKTKEKADLVLNYNSNSNLSNQLGQATNYGKTIWVSQNSGTASLSGNATIGSKTKPVVLVIDGNFKANGNTEIFGIVYVTKDWHNSGGGKLTIHGAVLVEGNFSGNGTPSVTYDTAVLNNLDSSNTPFTMVAGSWRDF